VVAPEKGAFDGMRDVASKPYTAADFRFTAAKDGTALYALALAWPADGQLLVRSLATGSGQVKTVTLLGHSAKINWVQTDRGLAVTLPAAPPCNHVFVLRIIGAKLKPAPIAP